MLGVVKGQKMGSRVEASPRRRSHEMSQGFQRIARRFGSGFGGEHRPQDGSPQIFNIRQSRSDIIRHELRKGISENS